MARTPREAAYRRGIWAELAAAALLSAKGYRLLARRFRCPHGEIDLVASRWTTLVFVEVKARASEAEAALSLAPRQQARIRRAAEAWLARHTLSRPASDAASQTLGDWTTIRFDVILVAPWRLPRHISDAFRD